MDDTPGGSGMSRLRKTQSSATSIPWATAQDKRLSFRARGVLTYLLSKPPGWRVNAQQIASDGQEGRGAVETALRELRECGYYRVIRYRSDDGARKGVWRSEGWVSDLPVQEWADEFTGNGGRSVSLDGYDPDHADEPVPTPENRGSETGPDQQVVPTPENQGSELPIPGFPTPGNPTPGNPGSLSSRSKSKKSEKTAPPTGGAGDPDAYPKRIIDDWYRWLRSQGKPVLGSSQSFHSLLQLVKQAVAAGATENQIKNALKNGGVAFPGKPQFQRELDAAMNGGRRPPTGGRTGRYQDNTGDDFAGGHVGEAGQ